MSERFELLERVKAWAEFGRWLLEHGVVDRAELSFSVAEMYLKRAEGGV